mgnify:CR=1 FL=1
MKYRGFCGPSYRSQAFTADQERLVNRYVERMESPGASTQYALYPVPGVKVLHVTTGFQGRAHEFYDGREFIVVANIFFELDSDAASTFRGFVAIDSNPATISWNGDGGGELFITSGGNGYLFTLATNVFASISALTGKATMGDMLDGYFLALDANTGTFYSSELQDGATWTTSTMFAQRSKAPDPWIALKVFGQYIWLLGSQTGEVWYDAGSSPFPFAPHPSGLVQYGTAAAWSVKAAGASLMWLAAAKDGAAQVMRASGFTPENVATYPVQFAMSQYRAVSDAYADSYSEAGHTFYILGFPSQNVASWVYDLEMQMWHERGTWDTTQDTDDFKIWRPRAHAYAFGEHRWLDINGGQVYRSGLDLYSDEFVHGSAEGIRWLRRAPAIFAENERIQFPSFELDVQPGVGLETGQGSDPQVMMRYSRDGGQTWSRERMRSAGKIGEYGNRCIWFRLGTARRMVIEVSGSDPVPFRITDARLPGIVLPERAA